MNMLTTDTNISMTDVITGPGKEPPRILIYGPAGIGKTLFASSHPNVVFIQTEEGLGNINVAHFPKSKNMTDVNQAIDALIMQDHNYQAVAFDSMDWMETYIWDEVIKENPTAGKTNKPVKDINGYGYAEGYKLAIKKWVDFFAKIDILRKERNMVVIFICHDGVNKFDDPEKGSYNYWGPKLHKDSMDKMVAYCDAVLFANYPIVIATDENPFGGSAKKRVMGPGTRVVMTQERPSFLAKNRYKLPAEIIIPEGDTAWAALWSEIVSKCAYYIALQKGEIAAPTPADAIKF